MPKVMYDQNYEWPELWMTGIMNNHNKERP